MNDHEFMSAIALSVLTGTPMKYACPYCGKEMPSGAEPSNWACCGEAGHAEKEPA